MDRLNKVQVWLGVSAVAFGLVACQHDATEDDVDTDGIDTDFCSSTTEAPDGAWDTAPYDWSDANQPGLEDDTNLPGIEALDGGIVAAAGGTAPLAVHAIHMSTGEAMLFHGHQDQFLWDVGVLSGSQGQGVPMNYRPMIDQRTWPRPNQGSGCGNGSFSDDGVERYPDLFCAGHAQLYDGTAFLAGGDVNGGPCGGGLKFAYLFDPSVQVQSVKARLM